MDIYSGIFYFSFPPLSVFVIYYFSLFFSFIDFPLYQAYLPIWMAKWLALIAFIGFASWGLYRFGLFFNDDNIISADVQSIITSSLLFIWGLISNILIIFFGVIISYSLPYLPLPIAVAFLLFALLCTALFLPAVTHYFLVGVRGVCRVLRFLLCIWEHPKATLTVWGMIGITIAMVCFSPTIPDIETYHQPEPRIYVYIRLISLCLIFYFIAVFFGRRFLDIYWIKHQPNVNSITRTALAENLSMLRTQKGRRAYAKYLLDHKTRLTGEWPDGVRPNWYMDKPLKLGFLTIQSRILAFDDILDHDLAKLESLELKTYRYMF